MGWARAKERGRSLLKAKAKVKGGGTNLPEQAKGAILLEAKARSPSSDLPRRTEIALSSWVCGHLPRGKARTPEQAHTRQRKGVTPDHPHLPPSDGELQQKEVPQRAAAEHRAKRGLMQNHQLRSPPRSLRTRRSFDEPHPTHRGTNLSQAQPHLPRGERQTPTQCQSSRRQPRSLAPESRLERRRLFHLGLSRQTASTSRLTGYAAATTVTSGCLTSAQPCGWIASQPSRVPTSWA